MSVWQRRTGRRRHAGRERSGGSRPGSRQNGPQANQEATRSRIPGTGTLRGPQLQKGIVAWGRNEGLSLKVLKSVKAKLGIKSIRKGRNQWVWALTRAEPKEGQER